MVRTEELSHVNNPTPAAEAALVTTQVPDSGAKTFSSSKEWSSFPCRGWKTCSSRSIFTAGCWASEAVDVERSVPVSEPLGVQRRWCGRRWRIPYQQLILCSLYQQSRSYWKQRFRPVSWVKHRTQKADVSEDDNHHRAGSRPQSGARDTVEPKPVTEPTTSDSTSIEFGSKIYSCYGNCR